MKKIIGRKKEIQLLDSIMFKNEAQLVIVYGRRRVGKTFLINEYFDNKFTFKITGVYKQPKDYQLKMFLYELKQKMHLEKTKLDDWFDAFSYLRKYLESLSKGEKRVVFFDEMPWLDTFKSDYVRSFEWFWNNYANTNSDLIFIACGSSASWITDKLLNNKGGFFNRHNLRIFVEPFTLKETEHFLLNKNITWSRYEIVQTYMIMGGIPYYLDKINKSYTFDENIDNLFFNKYGQLYDEFDKLYDTLFSNNEVYKKIVSVLSAHRYGLNRSEIAKLINKGNNGHISIELNNLINSGFVRQLKQKGSKNDVNYCVSDYFTLFYYRFVRDNQGKDDNYWHNSYNSSERSIWNGLTFENICFDHINEIKKALGISGVLSDYYTYLYKAKTEDEDGAQIDLVIDRKDNTLSLCEIKYTMESYKINKDKYLNFANKINVLKNNSPKRKSIQFVLISTFGLENSGYSNVVNRSITIDDLFKE